MSGYYEYKNQQYHCGNCDWAGFGSETIDNDDIDSFLEILCPKCNKNLDCVCFPTLEETLEFGTKEDKESAIKKQNFINRVQASRLKNHKQLPDIQADKIIITLCEVEQTAGRDADIVLLWKDKEIWREICTYEYYERYLELGRILKEKYGERLIDFEAKHTTYLGGDCSFAFDKVREFRQSLSK